VHADVGYEQGFGSFASSGSCWLAAAVVVLPNNIIHCQFGQLSFVFLQQTAYRSGMTAAARVVRLQAASCCNLLSQHVDSAVACLATAFRATATAFVPIRRYTESARWQNQDSVAIPSAGVCMCSTVLKKRFGCRRVGDSHGVVLSSTQAGKAPGWQSAFFLQQCGRMIGNAV
jgi:hypothetical protein